jgi:DNA processing protein
MTGPLPDDDDAAAAALAGLPYMGWGRLADLLGRRSPVEAWEEVRQGRHTPAWTHASASVSLADVAARHAARGVDIRRRGTPRYPAVLAQDHEAPPVVFTVGSLDPLERPRVAVIGTRRCTNLGRDVARQLGRELSEAGVVVVSGLAVGIDGAAHDGALAGGGAPPVGVVGSGLDVVYPRRHAALWQQVAQAGLLLSEAPLGCPPEPWRFPARNRIIAAVAHVLVVVESDVSGGSMHTVRAAEERGVPVLAVPGTVRSRASAGTNLLLSQGCHPALDTADVLTALSLVLPLPPQPRPGAPGRPGWSADADHRPEPPADAASVLDLLDWAPATLDEVVTRAGGSPAKVSAALSWLLQAGWVRSAGGWWERC